MIAQKKKKRVSKSPHSFTMRRAERQASEIIVILKELSGWINGLCGTQLKHDTLLDELAPGTILIKLLKIIHKSQNLKIKVHSTAQIGSFLAHENVNSFLRVIADMGVPMVMLFETSSLVTKEHRNESSVCYCLLTVAKIAWTKYKIEPPSIIKIQEKIDKRQDKKRSGSILVSTEENSKIKEEIMKVCKQNSLKVPEEVQPGEYKMEGGKTLFVRMIQNTALVRIDGAWSSLENTLVRKRKIKVLKRNKNTNGSDVASNEKSTTTTANATKIKVTEESEPIEKKTETEESVEPKPQSSSSTTTASSSTTTASSSTTTATTTTATTITTTKTDSLTTESSSSQDPNYDATTYIIFNQNDEEIAKKYNLKTSDYTARKEFFFLTALSVKMTHELRQDIQITSNQELFNRSLEAGKEFYEYNDFIKTELTKMYLKSNQIKKMNYGNTNSRAVRQKLMDSIQARKVE